MFGARSRSVFSPLVLISLLLLFSILVACGTLGTSGSGRAPSENDSSHLFTPMPGSTVTLNFGMAGEPFVLDGSRSQDDGAVRGFTWRQVSGPFVFTTSEGSLLRFVPQSPGTYVFELLATDNTGLASVVSRQAVVVQGDLTVAPGKTANAPLTCAVSLVLEGAAFDAAAIDRGNNVNWDFCGGGMLWAAGGDTGTYVVETLRVRKTGTLASEVDYGLSHHFSVEIDGIIQGGVTGVYSEKASIAAQGGVTAGSATGRVSGPGDAHYGSITIRTKADGAQELQAWWQEAAKGSAARKSGSVIYMDREGQESMRVNWHECFLTGYKHYVVDGMVTEPVEEFTLQCALGGIEAAGPDAELYRWVSDALQGRAGPRTLAVWEVMPDGSAGRAFLYHGAFPKEWTLPRSSNPLYEEGGTGVSPLYEGRADSSHVVEEIEFVVERVERAG